MESLSLLAGAGAVYLPPLINLADTSISNIIMALLNHERLIMLALSVMMVLHAIFDARRHMAYTSEGEGRRNGVKYALRSLGLILLVSSPILYHLALFLFEASRQTT
jgi:hypothetical protein